MKHELLMITITKRQPKYVAKKKEVWTVFDYEHIGRTWGPDDHDWSPDKDEFEHCYEDLEVGKSYLILTTQVDLPPDIIGGVEYKRWIWSGAMEFTPAQLTKIYNKYKTFKGDIRRTIVFADNLKYPTLNQDKFLEECGVSFE